MPTDEPSGEVRVIDPFGFEITDQVVAEFGSVEAMVEWQRAWAEMMSRMSAQLDAALGIDPEWRPTGVRNEPGWRRASDADG